MSKVDVLRLAPNTFIHVLDNNTNVSRVLVGPMTYTRLDHEVALHDKPQPCVCIPPDNFCVILNPAERDDKGALMLDKNGQVKVRLGDVEIRFAQQPFPLFPREKLHVDVKPLRVLSPLEALKVSASRTFEETVGGNKITRNAGDEWIVVGPCTYIPRIEVDVLSTINATVVRQNQALKIRAHTTFTDRFGVVRKAGEEWLYDKTGAFIPEVEEELVEVLNATVLTTKTAIHVEAISTFTDRFEKERRAGQQWLITLNETEFFIPTPNEHIVKQVELTVVSSRQYCVVCDFWKDGVQHLGQKELRKGRCFFFLHPGECLENDRVKNVYVLGADEALVLFATEKFTDTTQGDVKREAGDRWMLSGPTEYIPPTQAAVAERRKAIPLDINEGVYIRDIRSGAVRAQIGKTVMLTENEELWEKPLTPLVEELLQNPRLTKSATASGGGGTAWRTGTDGDTSAKKTAKARKKHKVVTCNVPHNALVQVYDYKAKEARVVKGPALVMLMPDEEFTVVSLSGGKPKKPEMIKSLCLHLGPDFMTDIIVVETLDHARLQLQMAYNWEFEDHPDVINKAFSVPDFVGDACKAIASRVRGFVASESFDSFHKNSTNIIKLAVFGKDGSTGKFKQTMKFPSNGLVVTNVDIHSVDPVDPKTRDALVKSVQLAIEITTKSQEASAQHKATTLEQEAKGRLERQIIADKALAEKERKELLEIDAHNAAIESTGVSKALSKAQADSKLIEGETEVALASKRSQSALTMSNMELDLQRQKQLNDIKYREALYDLEISKTRAFAKLEAEKFKKIIDAVGKDTIKAIAKAGPQLQAKLLQGLGLQGYLVTDGTNPINLFNTAKGMTAPPTTRATGGAPQ